MLVKRKEQKNEKKYLFICKMGYLWQSLHGLLRGKKLWKKIMSIETAIVTVLLLAYIIIDRLRKS